MLTGCGVVGMRLMPPRVYGVLVELRRVLDVVRDVGRFKRILLSVTKKCDSTFYYSSMYISVRSGGRV